MKYRLEEIPTKRDDVEEDEKPKAKAGILSTCDENSITEFSKAGESLAENEKRYKNRLTSSQIAEYNKQVYDVVYLRIRKDSGIMEAVRKMSEKHKMSVNEYIRIAIELKLDAEQN